MIPFIGMHVVWKMLQWHLELDYKAHFKAQLLRTGFGYIMGLQTKGYKACPTCGPERIAAFSTFLRKPVYIDATKNLPKLHLLRGDGTLLQYSGLLGRDTRAIPTPIARTPQDWYDTSASIEQGSLEVEESGMKRLSIWYTLPYWKVYKDCYQLHDVHGYLY